MNLDPYPSLFHKILAILLNNVYYYHFKFQGEGNITLRNQLIKATQMASGKIQMQILDSWTLFSAGICYHNVSRLAYCSFYPPASLPVNLPFQLSFTLLLFSFLASIFSSNSKSESTLGRK